MVSETLPKSLRLRRRRDFSRVQRQGARGGDGSLVAVIRPARGDGRFGLTVPRKVGNAVVRNKVKRRLREILRRDRSLFAKIDLVIICGEGAGDLDYAALRDCVHAALARARAALLKQPKRRPRASRPRHRRDAQPPKNSGGPGSPSGGNTGP